MLFSVTEWWTGTRSNFGMGLAIMVGGPILMRLLFEVQMMGILLVRNVMEIHKKMKTTSPEDDPGFVNPGVMNESVNTQPHIKE